MLQPITKENFKLLISQYSTGELENLVVKFPYVREAHILLAKKYQLENNPKFDQQLQLAALYTDDRELLFTLFADKPLEEPIFEGITVQVETEPAETVPITEPETLKPENEAAQEEKEPPLEEIDSVETIELIPVIEEKTEETPVTKEEETEETGFSPAERHSFDEWIKKLIPLASAIKDKPATEDEDMLTRQEEELNKTIMENTPVAYLHEKAEEQTHYSKGLDKFIEEQISKHKKTEHKKPAMQDDLDPELITETMAKIYEMQKKYTRAIRAYEILSLKFPEKNDFFAARINYLKNII